MDLPPRGMCFTRRPTVETSHLVSDAPEARVHRAGRCPSGDPRNVGLLGRWDPATLARPVLERSAAAGISLIDATLAVGHPAGGSGRRAKRPLHRPSYPRLTVVNSRTTTLSLRARTVAPLLDSPQNPRRHLSSS